MLSYSILITLSLLVLINAADPGPSRTNTGSSAPEGPAKQILLPSGPSHQYPTEIQYNVNLLEPQFQYPGFNYVPDKQPFPRIQPPVVFYAGAAPPGQQFLYRPGAPPGNFLVPQPQPQPGPGVIYGGANPQGPVFVAGYPKPAHIPPIEKDAEEIPNLAGNHPVTGSRNPVIPQSPPASKPEKLETFDEPVSAGEADVLAEADKNPNNYFPKKPFPNAPPALRPGQQFFILNGNPLFSNFPLQGVPQPPQPNYQPGIHHQQNPDVYLYRQPQYIPQLQHHQFQQVPIQDLFLRNSITGQISDVKPISGLEASLPLEQGNYISLNSADDFRNSFLLRNSLPVPIAPQSAPQKIISDHIRSHREYELAPVLLRTLPRANAPSPADEAQKAEFRLGKQIGTLDRGLILPGITAFGDYYRYAPSKNAKEEDDSVIIEAKGTNDDPESEAINAETKPEEPSLSQAQPSAIALAGNGGVASAAPKGTALAGIKGLAVARPQATAVAGPSKEEPEKKIKSKKERQ